MGHRSHAKGRAPSWTRLTWLFMFHLRPKAAPQCGQTYGFLPSCTVETWDSRCVFIWNADEHRWHLNGRRLADTGAVDEADDVEFDPDAGALTWPWTSSPRSILFRGAGRRADIALEEEFTRCLSGGIRRCRSRLRDRVVRAERARGG